MFEKRLKIFISILLIAVTILVLRLTDLQILGRDKYVAKTEKMLIKTPKWLATARGTIYDCKGRILARDMPDYKVLLHYKLTRLYDKRFWRFFNLEYLVRYPDKTEEDAIDYLVEKFGEQRKNADAMLEELAGLCQWDPVEIRQEIDKINDDIYAMRTFVARAKWYKKEKGPDAKPPRHKSRAEYMDDFVQCVPDEYQRLRLIYRLTPVIEMNEPHPIMGAINRDAAFQIEWRFNGWFLGETKDVKELQVVRIGANQQRQYPYKDAACHLIGQMGPSGADGEPKTGWQPSPQQLIKYYSGDRVGAWGVEYMFESRLRGSRGWIRKDIEDNIVEHIDKQVGSNVAVTIDIELQKSVGRILAGQNSLGRDYRGGAVVIDVLTGNVLALVSNPTFDLNTYYEPTNYCMINHVDPNDPDIWDGVIPRDPDSGRKVPPAERNLALGENYQPGSTSKPTHLLGELDAGVVNENTSYECYKNHTYWGSGPEDIHNHGQIKAFDAIKKSCNLYFVITGMKMGSVRQGDWLRKAGFGRRILAWPDELLASRSYWAFRETGGSVAFNNRSYASESDLMYVSFGRGGMGASVLQIANSMATIARDGVFLAPTIIADPPVSREPPPPIASLKNVRLVQAGMAAVVNEYGGTAFMEFKPLPWKKDNVKIFAKTGSTDYSVFGCYAKTSDNRCLAVAVLAEAWDKLGSEVAAPLAREILMACGKLGYLPQSDL